MMMVMIMMMFDDAMIHYHDDDCMIPFQGLAPLGDSPLLKIPVLLGHLHAPPPHRQPHHPPRRHLLLQRRPLHQQDHLQRCLRHHLPL